MANFWTPLLNSWGRWRYASAEFFVENFIFNNFSLKYFLIQSAVFAVFSPKLSIFSRYDLRTYKLLQQYNITCIMNQIMWSSDLMIMHSMCCRMQHDQCPSIRKYIHALEAFTTDSQCQSSFQCIAVSDGEKLNFAWTSSFCSWSFEKPGFVNCFLLRNCSSASYYFQPTRTCFILRF